MVHIFLVSASTEISIYRIVSSLTQEDSGYFSTFLTISASSAKCKRYHKLMMDWTFPAQWREHNYENRQKYQINHARWSSDSTDLYTDGHRGECCKDYFYGEYKNTDLRCIVGGRFRCVLRHTFSFAHIGHISILNGIVVNNAHVVCNSYWLFVDTWCHRSWSLIHVTASNMRDILVFLTKILQMSNIQNRNSTTVLFSDENITYILRTKIHLFV